MAEPTTYTGLLASIENYVVATDAAFVAQAPTFILFGQKRIARELKILGLQTYVTGSFAASQGVVVKPDRWLETLSMNWGNGDDLIQSVTVVSGGAGYHEPLTFTTSGGTGSGGSFQGSTLNGVITQVAVVSPGSWSVAPNLVVAGSGDVGAGASLTVNVGTTNSVRNQLLPRSYEFCRNYWPNPNLTGNPRYYADYGFDNWLVVPTPSAAFPLEIAYYQLDNPITPTSQTNWLTENASDLLLYACLYEAALFLKDADRIALYKDAYERAGQAYTIEDRERINDRAQVRRAS